MEQSVRNQTEVVKPLRGHDKPMLKRKHTPCYVQPKGYRWKILAMIEEMKREKGKVGCDET